MERQFQGPVSPSPKWNMFPYLGVHKRVVPRGITGLTLFTVGALTSLIGHYFVAQNIKRRHRDEREQLEDRINILPILMAEQDRAYLIARKNQLAEEEKYGKNIPGFVVGQTPYATTWIPPNQFV